MTSEKILKFVAQVALFFQSEKIFKLFSGNDWIHASKWFVFKLSVWFSIFWAFYFEATSHFTSSKTAFEKRMRENSETHSKSKNSFIVSYMGSVAICSWKAERCAVVTGQANKPENQTACSSLPAQNLVNKFWFATHAHHHFSALVDQWRW